MEPIKKRLLIIQPSIPSYREPIFNALGEIYDLTIVHSGRANSVAKATYKQIYISKFRFGPFSYQPKLIKIINNKKYDSIIAVFDVRLLSVVFSLLNKKCKFILWGHRYGKKLLINIFRDYLMRKADAILLYGDEEVARICQKKILRDKIFIAPNTLYVENHEDCTRYPKNSFLFVGRAQPRKKIGEFIRAFASIRSQLPDGTHVNIVGSGIENDKIRQLANVLGVSQYVIFHGEIIDDNRLKSIFMNAYAYISPGDVGLGVLHSFAYGVPVVTRKKMKHGPEFYNLEHNVNSIIYDNSSELPSILRKLVFDETFALILGRNAYKKYADERNINVMINGFVECIENTLNP